MRSIAEQISSGPSIHSPKLYLEAGPGALIGNVHCHGHLRRQSLILRIAYDADDLMRRSSPKSHLPSGELDRRSSSALIHDSCRAAVLVSRSLKSSTQRRSSRKVLQGDGVERHLLVLIGLNV
jgi:hypothetical protein